MKEKRTRINHTQAINIFYNGVKGLSEMKLPFKCKCGSTTYLAKIDDLIVKLPVFSVHEIFKHIRSMHKDYTITKLV